jgi:hypothetical protein
MKILPDLRLGGFGQNRRPFQGCQSINLENIMSLAISHLSMKQNNEPRVYNLIEK